MIAIDKLTLTKATWRGTKPNLTNDDQRFEEHARKRFQSGKQSPSVCRQRGIRTDNAAAPTWITASVFTHLYGKPRAE